MGTRVAFYYYFFESTLNNTLTAKKSGDSSCKPKVKLQYLIYSPKRDAQHPRPFDVKVVPGICLPEEDIQRPLH